MPRRAWLLLSVAVLTVLSGQVLAGTVNLSSAMPQGVDPPCVKLLNTGGVTTNGAELAPTAGVGLHGRSPAAT